MKSRAVLVLATAAVFASLLNRPVFSGPEKQQPPVHGNLHLDDLTPSPTQRLDQQLFSPAAQPATPAAAQPQGPPTPGVLDEHLQRELGRAGRSEGDSPLVDVARTMYQVRQRIGQADSGRETQEMQGRILANLDELLRQASRRCQACQGTCQPGQQAVTQRDRVEQPKDIEAAKNVKRKNSGGGADPSRAITGPDKVSPAAKAIHQPNMEEMRALLKALWGELPEREREQMLQLPVEEFLPKYELLIEQYFRRLSEQQSQPPAGSGP